MEEKIKGISLDSLLALFLVAPFILSSGLAPRSTPYWFFTIIFVLLLSLVALDLFKRVKKYNLVKDLIVVFLIVGVISSSLISQITLRHQTVPTFQIHDIIIQQEEALRMFLIGKNPYAETYFDTPLEEWNYSETNKNPALYHFVMQPLYLVSAIPFYAVSGRLFGFFDARIPLLALFYLTLLFAYLLVKDGVKRRSFLLLLAFNPLSVAYLIEGRSDFYMLGFLLPSLYFLYKKKNIFSSIFLGMAFAVKQSVWPLFPFYFAYLFLKEKDKTTFVKSFAVFSFTFLIIVLPFFFWNPKAFIDSTIFYLSGNVKHAYPISGYGFGMLLYQFGYIKNIYQSFPFSVFQLSVSLPLLVILVLYLKRNLNVKTLILVYAVFLFVFWYFSRYFNNSHIIYVVTLFVMAYFWPTEKDRG